MKKTSAAEREQAFLDAMRREAQVRTAGPTAARAAPAAPAGATAVAVPRTPLDAPTVAGWDHPAAQPAPAADEKWSRIAALMDAERREAQRQRERAKRAGVYFVGALIVLILFAGAAILAR